MVRISFVCLGNICRSPTAECVLRQLVKEAGLEHAIEVDSAGTAGYHVGEPPDSRSAAYAAKRGIVVQGAARQWKAGDWERFDYVLAMDDSNFANLSRGVPEAHRNKLYLCLSFDPRSAPGASVPDPYYGGNSGFDDVLDLLESACRGLLEHVRREHQL